MTIWDVLDNQDALNNIPVIQFYGSSTSYPMLFFTYLLEKLSSQNKHIISLEIDFKEIDRYKHMFSMRFFETPYCYWLKHLAGTNNELNSFLQYMERYQGPNTILFYSDAVLKNSSHICRIALPDVTDHHVIVRLLNQGHHNVDISQQLITMLGKSKKTITLDSMLMLRHYLILLGNNTTEFIAEWLPNMIHSETSLFSLSEYFFAKDAKRFFQCWNYLRHQYSPPFWTVFWAEQIWRAYYFIHYMYIQKFHEAKKIGSRLPFRFLNRDWKKISVVELKIAHNNLYHLDYRLKQGSSTIALDLFYLNFLYAG